MDSGTGTVTTVADAGATVAAETGAAATETGVAVAAEAAGEGVAAAAEAATAAFEAIGTALPIVGAAIGVTMVALSDMPDEGKAAFAAIDVISAVAAPFTYGLSVVAGFILKSILAPLFPAELSHKQRELLELSHTLRSAANILGYITRSLTPKQLWANMVYWQSGYVGGASWNDVAVEISYFSPKFGHMVGIGSIPDTVMRGYPIGDADDLVEADPASIVVSIQAGVTPSMLNDANAKVKLQLTRLLDVFHAARHDDLQANATLAHVWWMRQENVIADIDAAMDPEFEAAFPMAGEYARVMFYTRIARLWGFDKWTDLLGFVLQSRWDSFRASNQHPTFAAFTASLGYHDIRDLRRDVFLGKWGNPPEDHPDMWQQISGRLDQIEKTIAALRVAVNTNAAPNNTGSLQVTSSGSVVAAPPPPPVYDAPANTL